MQHRTTDLNRTSDPDVKGIVEAGSAKVYLNNYGKPHMPSHPLAAKDMKGDTIRESQNKVSHTEEANGSPALAVSLPL